MEEMAKIEATTGGGVQRLSFSDEDKASRDLFVHWLKALNLNITIDEMGNIIRKRLGRYSAGKAPCDRLFLNLIGEEYEQYYF
jgi:hypothetical protein